MKRLLIIALVFLLPTAFAEISHSPKELSEGEEFTAWIDTDGDVKSITFYVCTLKDPYTCYKPETMDRNDSVNNRFQFTYKVKNNDYPGYKYELEKDDNSTEKIPASEYSYYEGLEVEKMGDSYYFKVDIKTSETDENSSLPAPTFISVLILITTLAFAGRR
ncbi:MAG TPA: hypothetical protein QGI59_00875 [Candidatus Poseidoniia archaeon]|jgi:hypothetical protein|nr:hypothetical protein [Candidatus Poseidoniia archaeon]|tara:strand:- start:1374 stop:1859 length:486 start_codon:yes stop_codon:yes gene_type:complete